MNPSNRIVNKANELGFNSNQAKLILCQAKHETGNFTSALYLIYNNAFGMNVPENRQFAGTNPGHKGYAHYDSLEDSVEDLSLWFDAVGFTWFETPEQFCAELKKHDYFTDNLTNYSNDVSKYYYA